MCRGPLSSGQPRTRQPDWRIPAANVRDPRHHKTSEAFLADEGAVLDAVREEHGDGAAQSRLIARGVKIAQEIEFLYARPDPRHADDAA